MVPLQAGEIYLAVIRCLKRRDLSEDLPTDSFPTLPFEGSPSPALLVAQYILAGFQILCRPRFLKRKRNHA